MDAQKNFAPPPAKNPVVPSIAARRLELISSMWWYVSVHETSLCRKSVLKKSNRADPDFLFPKPLRFPDTCIPKHCNFDKQRLRCEVLSNRPFPRKKTAFPQLIHHCVSILALPIGYAYTLVLSCRRSLATIWRCCGYLSTISSNVTSKLPFENGYPPGLLTFDSHCQGAFETFFCNHESTTTVWCSQNNRF